MSMPLIAILTDFGTTDVYVGIMKAVVLSLVPEARMVDITHQVAPHDIRQGAFHLSAAARYFPTDTVFLAVVDPGVGSERKGLIARAGPWTLVGPDNGLFTFFWLRHPDARAYQLTAPEYRLPTVSHTFQGRDVFAPAAAWALRGVAPERFGPRVPEPVSMASILPTKTAECVEGVVLHVDRFGNLVSNFEAEWLERQGIACHGPWHILVGRTRVRRIIRTYAEAPWDEPVALWGSSGFLEVSLRETSAAEHLGVSAGAPVRLVLDV